MKATKLIFIPLVLGVLVSCSTQKKSGVTLNDIPFDYYDKMSKELYGIRSCSLKVNEIEFDSTSEYSNITSNFLLKTNDEGQYIYNLSKNLTSSVIVEGMNYYSDSRSYFHIDEICFYTTASLDGGYNLYVETNNETRKFTSNSKINIVSDRYNVSSSTDKSETVYKVTLSGDTDFSLYFLTTSSYKEGINESNFITQEKYANMIVNAGPIKSYVNGKFSYSCYDDSDLAYCYNEKGKYVGTINFGVMKDPDEYYTISYNNLIYFIKSYDYYESEFDHPSETLYRTEAYVFDLKTAKTYYYDDLDFMIDYYKGIRTAYNNDDSVKNIAVSYHLLKDGVASKETYCTLLDNDFSSFNGNYLYNDDLFRGVYKLTKDKYYVSLSNRIKIVEKTKTTYIDDIYYIFGINENTIFYRNQYGFMFSMDINELDNFNKKEKMDETITSPYLLEGKKHGINYNEKNSTYKIDGVPGYLTLLDGNMLNLYYTFDCIITTSGLYKINGEAIYELKKGEKLTDWDLSFTNFSSYLSRGVGVISLEIEDSSSNVNSLNYLIELTIN